MSCFKCGNHATVFNTRVSICVAKPTSVHEFVLSPNAYFASNFRSKFPTLQISDIFGFYMEVYIYLLRVAIQCGLCGLRYYSGLPNIRLDKFWQDQDVLYIFKANICTGSPSQVSVILD